MFFIGAAIELALRHGASKTNVAVACVTSLIGLLLCANLYRCIKVQATYPYCFGVASLTDAPILAGMAPSSNLCCCHWLRAHIAALATAAYAHSV